MADYTSLVIDGNKGSDASPSWTVIATDSIAFGGSAGANEMRWIGSGGAGNVASASWPYTTRPASGTAAVGQLWLYKTDNSGVQVATYDGNKTNSLVLRLNHDNTGTYASAPRWSAFASSALSAPTPGTQVDSPTDGTNIINGQTTDSNNESYLKGNGYGSGYPTGGAQETPSAGAAGTTLAVTSGTTGTVSPSAASWLATWQDLAGWTDYITLPAIPKSVTALFYYFTLALFMGVNMKPGTMPFCPVVWDYTYA